MKKRTRLNIKHRGPIQNIQTENVNDSSLLVHTGDLENRKRDRVWTMRRARGENPLFLLRASRGLDQSIPAFVQVHVRKHMHILKLSEPPQRQLEATALGKLDTASLRLPAERPLRYSRLPRSPKTLLLSARILSNKSAIHPNRNHAKPYRSTHPIRRPHNTNDVKRDRGRSLEVLSIPQRDSLAPLLRLLL